MAGVDTPTVLVTRPRRSSDAFLAALAEVARGFEGCISPAFENVAVASNLSEFDAAVFTSGAALAFAPDGEGRTAYCVGSATAHAARAAGYRAIASGGNAADLIHLILGRKPAGKLLHMRGAVSIGDVAAQVCRFGVVCDERVVYRKNPCAPTPAAVRVLASTHPVILPVFSAETALIMASWPAAFLRCTVVAISPAVASAAQGLNAADHLVADVPTLDAMVDACARLIA